MNYLQDRKVKRRRYFYVLLLLIFLFILFYFRSGVWQGFSKTAHVVFRPVLILGSWAGGEIGQGRNLFTSKLSLQEEIENLKERIREYEGTFSNQDALQNENETLKEILGRKNSKTQMTLAAILAKPNQSPYDTLVIDIGADDGVQKGNMVFVGGFIPLGRIMEVYPDTSKVILFSSAGEKTQVAIGNIFMEIVGRGGGNFEMILPRNFTPQKGDEVVLTGITPNTIAKVETIISDPRDPFVKALLVSPVNIQEIKFVQIPIDGR